MILELENWHLGYAQIVKDCQAAADNSISGDEPGGTVLILCNADVDAMAAARILSFMLRSDNITYQLRPCTSFSALKQLISSTTTNNLRALVLLNLGASRNLTRLFEEHGLSVSTTRVYVMDCRRPFHLANVHAGQNVVVFWDETTAAQVEDIPSDGDNLSGNESTSSEEDDDDSSSSEESEGEEEFDDDASEGEEEFDDGGDLVAASAQPRPAPVEQEEDQGYDAEDDAEQEDDLPGAKRHKKEDFPDDSSDTTKERDHDEDRDTPKEFDESPDDAEQAEEEDEAQLDPREMHRQRRIRLRMYYSGGSFYGSPAAYVAYRLSTQLRFAEQGNLLWLACVGVTDAYLHSRLDVAGYTSLSLSLKQYCMRLYPNDMYSRLENTTYAEHLMGTSNRDASRHLTSITLSENGRVLAEQDFRFFLLRHTSLYDGMVHSNYVSTKLQLWTKKGLSHFHELLAKMGCPLEQCRQPYVFMNPKVRRSLRDKLTTFADVSLVFELASASFLFYDMS
jgi:cell division control protein 45